MLRSVLVYGKITDLEDAHSHAAQPGGEWRPLTWYFMTSRVSPGLNIVRARIGKSEKSTMNSMPDTCTFSSLRAFIMTMKKWRQ